MNPQFWKYTLDKMPSFAEYRIMKNSKKLLETEAIYDGSPTYDSNRDWNWWGSPDIYKKKKKKKKSS